MARKDKTEAKPQSADEKLLLELRDRYKKCVEHDKENRAKYRENMRFALVPGEQWDATTKKERGNDRPMYEFNEIRIKGKAIVNQIRANRPSAKITPAEDGDVELAEAMKAQIQQIENSSDGDAVQDYAAHHQVFGGMGAERYVTQWQEDSVDGQDILIEPVNNPMCLYADYACQKQDKSDARFWIYAAKLTKDTYKSKYPKAEVVEFDVEDEFEDDCDDNHVWVAEYWVKKPVMRELALLSDGKTIDLATVQALPEGVTVVKTRRAPGHRIVQYICSGNAVLADESGEKEHEWAGKEFPFNIVYGEYTVIDGKTYWCGITEYGKDAQRALNWAGTSVFEAIAATPQSVTWVTPEQAKDHVPSWVEAQRKNIGIRLYNHDPKAPGPPQTTPPASIPTALVSAFQMASDNLKACLGMPDATLGEKGAENSGIAIRRRQEAGAVANFNYGDNITNFIRRRYEILIDLTPKVKDTAYSIRVLGKDGAEKWVKLNDIDPVTGEKLNDLSALKYDLVVTQGPNFATQRQEAAEIYMGMQQSNPLLAQAAPDLIFKALDLPYSQEIAERMKAVLPPQIQAVINKDKPQDPSVVAAMAQVEQMQAQVQEQAQLVDEATQKATQDQASATKAKSDVQVAEANLKVQEAELGKAVAEFKTMVAEAHLKLAQAESAKQESDHEAETTDRTAESEALFNGIAAGLEALREQTAQLIQSHSQQLAQIVSAPKPAKVAVSERINGKLVTRIMDAEALQ